MNTTLNKILLALACVLLLALAITPKVVGINIRDNALANLEQMLPANTQALLTIEQQSFESGWMDSSAVIKVSYDLDPLQRGAEALELLVELDIQHGPLLFTPAGIRLGSAYAEAVPRIDNESLASVLAELPFALPTTRFELLLGFDQSLALNIVVEPINHQDSQSELNFEGLNASLVANRDQSANFLLSMERLKAREQGAAIGLMVEGLEISSYTEQLDKILAPSSATLKVASLSSEGPYAVQLQNLSIESRIGESQSGSAQSDIYQHLEFGNLDSELPLSRLSWTLEVNEIQNELIDNYYQMLINLQEQMTASPGTVNNAISELSQELLLALIQNRLVLNNHISASAFGGEHRLDFTLEWNGLPQLNDVVELNLNEAVAALTAELKLELELEAIMRSPVAELVDPYVQQGYIEVSAGKIALNAAIEQGELQLNGDILDLSTLY